ncbi:MAG: ketose-bisphosphate aldolase, partial [Chloroflexi bacterium]|nr:ketose-bisphosphate aldolase [Chloroflexota bacterium]
ETFSKRNEVNQILLGAQPEELEPFRERFAATLGFLGANVYEGGRIERWETVKKAQGHVADDITHIAVHDAARPGASKKLLDRIFEAAASLPAVVPGLEVRSTIKRVSAEVDSVGPAEDDGIADAMELLNRSQETFTSAVGSLKTVRELRAQGDGVVLAAPDRGRVTVAPEVTRDRDSWRRLVVLAAHAVAEVKRPLVQDGSADPILIPDLQNPVAVRGVAAQTARAGVAAATNLRAPVMVQTSEGAVKHAGFGNIASIVRRLAEEAPVPVALHMDHGKSIEVAREAVEAGYTSVMIDTSRLPLAENIAATREIVEYAHDRDVQVEAEIGQLAGIEDLGEVPAEATFTVPEEAVRFVAETGVDSLTITIGTSHGAFKFKGEPRLDFDRLAAIAKLIDNPIVLHGASAVRAEDVAFAEQYGARLPKAKGIPEEFIKRAISLCVAKINTDSDLRLAALARMRQVLTERPDIFNLYELMGEVEDATRAAVEARIRLFGSEGKAAQD